jgi:hypothetical protein
LTENTKPNVVIPYARVSTNSPAQLSSLGSQFELLKIYGDVTSDIGSVAMGIRDKLRHKIEMHRMNGAEITLVVTSLDRITRCMSDIQFIKTNVNKIIIVNSCTYNVDRDWKIIMGEISSATDEIDIIRKRAIKSSNRKRRRLDSGLDMRTAMNKKRCDIAKRNLEMNGISTRKVKRVKKLIKSSQKLKCEADWIKLSNESKRLNGSYIMNEYPKSSKSDTPQHLMRKDITEYVKNILGKGVDDIYIKDFVNATLLSIQLDRKNREQSEDNEDTIEKINKLLSTARAGMKVKNFSELQRLIFELNKHNDNARLDDAL